MQTLWARERRFERFSIRQFLQRILSIVEKGYTRIPIYEGGRKGRVVAVLNVKDLIATDFTKDVIVIDVLQKLNYLKQVRLNSFVHAHLRRRQSLIT